MTLAVATLAVGPHGRALLDVSHESLARYAHRLGAALVVLDSPRIGHPNVTFEKYQLAELLARHDRVLYLDADLLVSPRCEDLFARVPPEDLGAFVVGQVHAGHDAAVAHLLRALPPIPSFARGYFNTGVMVLSARHAPMFSLSHGAVVAFGEQTQLNYNCYKLGFSVHDIGWRNNHTAAVAADRLESGIVHYAGDSHVAPGRDRLGQMRADWPLLAARGALR